MRLLLFPNPTAGAKHTVEMHYFRLPINVKQSYTLHEVETAELPDSIAALVDTSRHLKLTRLAQSPDQTENNPFLGNFQKSGSIARGFQLGSTQSLNLTSGFNLQFSGDLAKDVNISGALTEENTPIQPEGNTQTLHDIDRVFIKMKIGQHVSATFGDFFLDLNDKNLGKDFESSSSGGTIPPIAPIPDQFNALNDVTFTNFSRKLLGVQAAVTFGGTSLMFSGATAQGKFNTTIFQGQEGFQGPYQLTGKNGEPTIVVIAGTERVYVDGVLQTRGARNDYVIDYALGQIQFQPQRLITSASRISVDFQYTDEQYSRSFFAGEARSSFFDGKASITANFVREGDNQDAPLQLTFSDSDKTLLSQAGSDPSKAVKSGVVIVPRTSTGAAIGSYDRFDTTISGVQHVAYTYTPLDTVNAIYNITFGFAGTGQGSYTRLAIGQFQYVGPNGGDWDTLQYLPLPQLTQVIDLVGTIHPIKSLGISGELAESQFTPNRFDNHSITDAAYNVRALYSDTLQIGNTNLGTLSVHGLYRNINKNFTTIDRVEDVEFLRRYGLDQTLAVPATGLSNNQQQLSETSVIYSPVQALSVEAGYGNLNEIAVDYTAKRFYATAQLSEDTLYRPHLFADYEQLPYSDSSTHESGKWLRFNGQANKSFQLGTPTMVVGGAYAFEQRTATPFQIPNSLPDTLTPRSFNSTAWTPSIAFQFTKNFSMSGSFEARADDSTRFGNLTEVSKSQTYRFITSIGNIGGFGSNLTLTYRKKDYLDLLASLYAGGNQSTLLMRFEPRYATNNRWFSLDGVYEISNARAAQIQRVFIPVQPGLGSYTYLGDLNHNGKQDPNDFQLARYTDQADYVLLNVPTTTLFPTTNLKSSARLHFDADQLLKENTTAQLWTTIVKALSLESSVRVEETSTDPDPNDIYFFKLSHFQNALTTLQGIIELDQDLFILANDPDQSYRLRFFERRGANQYNTGLERTYNAERSIRGRFKPSSTLTNETTIAFTTDLAFTDSASFDQPHSTTATSIVSDWSFHPTLSPLDYGLRLEGSRAVEHSTNPFIYATTTAVTFRTDYALESKTRLRLELERDELDISNQPSTIPILPYSLTSGRAAGTTWLWRLALDYNLGSGIVATVSYDGRNQEDGSNPGSRVTIHNARAEIRASF
jgi:hypothetical protein